ncbi:ZDHC1 palmitoyltransferase, partial [Galbula dea]|nr:ZDHC1 palmitoyltransferase [Galbula dea]
MNICNKPPSKTAPENLAAAAPELQTRRARRNGWSRPLHLFQITAWLLYVFFALVGFGILVPLLPQHWLPAGYVCPGVCFLYHLVVHLTAVSIDPADANVRARNYPGPLGTFDRSQHGHVIQNRHCRVCDVHVSAKSKHCGTCNKCVCGFDHHCKWLNNCVGERNYWLFLNSVLSAVLGQGLLLLIACYIFVEFFVDPGRLRSDHHFDALKNHTDLWFVFLPAAPLETQATAILVTAGIFILLSLMTVLLLGHLLIFHIYLMWNKLTTYEYILQQRPQEEEKEADKQLELYPSQVRASWGCPWKQRRPQSEVVPEGITFSICCVSFSFPKLYGHSADADLQQSSSPNLPSGHFGNPPQQQKKRRKKTQKAASSAAGRRSKAHSRPWPSLPPLQSEFPAMTAATSSSPSLHLLVPAFPLRAAATPSSCGFIQAAGPPADYHSESAESLEEIPVAQTHLGSTALPEAPKKTSSNSPHSPLRSCQQDRHLEQDLELFSKIPAVFVSQSSGEPQVCQAQLRESTAEP